MDQLTLGDIANFVVDDSLEIAVIKACGLSGERAEKFLWDSRQKRCAIILRWLEDGPPDQQCAGDDKENEGR